MVKKTDSVARSLADDSNRMGYCKQVFEKQTVCNACSVLKRKGFPHLVVPLFSAESMAISKATGSSAGRSGRRSEVRKLNMSGGDLALQQRERERESHNATVCVV